MKRLVLLLLLSVLGAAKVISQQLGDIKSISVSTPLLELIPLGKQGFLMFEYQARNLKNDQVGLVISRYDQQLTKMWDSMLPFSKGLQLTHYQYSDGYLFIVLSGPKNQQMEIFRMNVDNAQGYQLDYSFSNPFYPSTLLASGSRVWISGIMAHHGVLFELNQGDNKYSTLPAAYAEPVSSISGLNYHQETKVLSYLLRTTIDKRQSYIFRGLDIDKNRVVFDVPLNSIDNFNLDQVIHTYGGDRQFITGTFFKKNPEQTGGLFQYAIENGKIVREDFQLFKDIPQFSNYLSVSAEGYEMKSSRRGPVQVQIDKVIYQESDFLVFLELIEKQFQAKGALQQEFEQNHLVNYLDENQSGQRSFDQAASFTGNSQSAEDRIYRGSATEILNYRYRNAILSQPIFQGFAYRRSIVFQFKERFSEMTSTGIQAPGKEVDFMQTTNTFEESPRIRQIYDRGGMVYTWLYHPKNREFSAFEEVPYLQGKGKLFQMGGDQYLGANVVKEDDGFVLNLQKITL